jgi:ribonucleotide monophosphatase NagD (HAD superfamily)
MPNAGALPGSIRGLLFDIDGTLLVHDRPIPGAAEALARCGTRGLRYCLVTNTTGSRRPRREPRSGLGVAAAAVLQPAVLARRMILDSGRRRAGLLVPEEARADLEGVEPDELSPDWVVVADIGARFDYGRMNTAFGWLRGGARLLALHLFGFEPDLVLDSVADLLA